MGYIVIAGICFFIAFALQKISIPRIDNAFVKFALSAVIALFGVGFILMTSYVNVPAGHIATMHRIYLADSLPAGKIMMFDKENTYKGPQAEYLTEGFHFRLLINVLHDVDFVKLVNVPKGSYLELVARDGATLPAGEFMAPEWSLPEDEMLKPEVFLTNNGFKGTQLTVLRPGKYPIHPGLWDVKVNEALTVQTGEVAVIHSNVQLNKNLDCSPIKSTASPDGEYSAPLVRNGCRGVWVEPLPAGAYYLNRLAFTPTIQSTRAMVWNYKGGYTRRELTFTVDDAGDIKQDEKSTDVDKDKDYADGAVLVRTIDGWTVPIELRVPFQVYPSNAPRVVAGVGSTEAIEDRVITPIIYDVTRQIAGKTKAVDLISKRADIVKTIEQVVIAEAAKSGVTVQEVRLDDIVLPPELLLPERRKQLASSLADTYEQERLAALKRVDSQNAKATASQQAALVTAQMTAQSARLSGEGQRDSMKFIAEGQRAQREVIGAEAAVQLQMFDKFLEAAIKNPDIIKVPVISVQGGSGSAEGMAAVLGGSSNMAAFMKMNNDLIQKSAKPQN